MSFNVLWFLLVFLGVEVVVVFYFNYFRYTKGKGASVSDTDLRLPYWRFRKLYPNSTPTYEQFKRMQTQRAYKRMGSTRDLKRMVR